MPPRKKKTNLVTVEESLAFMATPEERQRVIDEISAIFLSEGNPMALGARYLERWEPFFARLVEEGILIRFDGAEKRQEYGLADQYRMWIPVSSLTELLECRLKGATPEQHVHVLSDFTQRYQHNPGAAGVVAAVKQRLYERPDLATYIRERESSPQFKLLRQRTAPEWSALVMWVRYQSEPSAIMERLGGMDVLFKGRWTKAKISAGDVWALSQAKTIKDIEFILDHLPPVEVQAGRPEGSGDPTEASS